MMIEDYFVGHWNNRMQCSMYPTEYSNIHSLWEKIDGGLRSRQWRNSEGIDNAYHDLYHKFIQDGQTNYRMESYTKDWTKRHGCDIILIATGSGFTGSDSGTCYINWDVLVKTKMEVTKDTYKVFDYGTRGGKFVFGNDKFFEFKRIN